MPFWTYILHCNAGVFYTGHTDDLERRIAQHETGAIEGFTKRYLPVKLVWSQEFASRDEAKEAERKIEGWSRKKKLALIRGDWEAVSRYSKKQGSPSTSSGRTDFGLTQLVLDGLLQAAAHADPNECCGIMFGDDNTITSVRPAHNVHYDPATHFEIDPKVLIAAYRAEREGGPKVAGFYHSHPTGNAEPSVKDAASAAGDGKIWAIIAGEEVTFWRDTPQGFEPLSYRVINS